MMKGYLQTHRHLFFYLLVVIAIFFSLAYLYGLSQDGMIYAPLLVLFFSFFFLVQDFQSYQKKVKTLTHFLLSAGNEPLIMEENPAAFEKEYIQLYNHLFDMYRKSQDESLDKSRQMMDYYSLWVHQIKTPIAAMHLILQNQKNMDLTLENELFKIEQYVEMVLSYLRLDSGTSDYRFEEVDVDKVTREVIHKYSRLFIQKKLSFHFEPTHFIYLTDEKWFSFVLEQILSNAIKYTYNGGVRIYRQDQWLVIEDDGIGISEEDLPRIFEKGYTGYNGRMDKKSTGIGLYLTKEVTQRLGIGILVNSSSGKGTRVHLDLSPKHLDVE